MKQRIQKLMAESGLTSRRKAEAWIQEGRVTVNGALCALGDTADPETDEILVDGKPLAFPQNVYILLNKPRGYVTTARDEKGRRTVLELVDCGERVYPVGRLDMDSEGLLLLTNDGALTNALLHPSSEVEKTYRVWLQKADASKISAMGGPMRLEGRAISPAAVKTLWLRDGGALLEMTIHEGRNRQIRKMAEKCGMSVTRLQRIREGPLELGDLPKGQWRYLTEEEREKLKFLHQKI